LFDKNTKKKFNLQVFRLKISFLPHKAYKKIGSTAYYHQAYSPFYFVSKYSSHPVILI